MMIDREKVARAVAETYHGKPISDQYLTGVATGGRVWLTAADAAIAAVLEQLRERANDFAGEGAQVLMSADDAPVALAEAVWLAMLDTAFLQAEPSSNPAE